MVTFDLWICRDTVQFITSHNSILAWVLSLLWLIPWFLPLDLMSLSFGLHCILQISMLRTHQIALFFWTWKSSGCSLPLVLLSFCLSPFVNLPKQTYKNAHGTLLLRRFKLFNGSANISRTLQEEFKFFAQSETLPT